MFAGRNCRENFSSELFGDVHCAPALFAEGNRDSLDRLLVRFGIAIIPFDEEQARLAADAYVEFGKGRHAARLNLGNCFSYALAKQTGEPLLFKGNDFSQTDVLVAKPSA